MPGDDRISLNEAARRAGVSPATLTRWADEKVVPVRKGRWTPAAAAQARIVARMRERGHTLEELKEAGKEGKLSFGMAEDLFADPGDRIDVKAAAEERQIPLLYKPVKPAALRTALNRSRKMLPKAAE